MEEETEKKKEFHPVSNDTWIRGDFWLDKRLMDSKCTRVSIVEKI